MPSKSMIQGEHTVITLTLQATTVELNPADLKFRLEKNGKTLVEKSEGSEVVINSTTEIEFTLLKSETLNADLGNYQWGAKHIAASTLFETEITFVPDTLVIKKRKGWGN